MRKSARSPQGNGKYPVGCYKYDAKAFAVLSLLATIEAILPVVCRNPLLSWISAHCSAVSYLAASYTLVFVAIVCSIFALAGYVCAFVSASQYCIQVRSANQ